MAPGPCVLSMKGLKSKQVIPMKSGILAMAQNSIVPKWSGKLLSVSDL